MAMTGEEIVRRVGAGDALRLSGTLSYASRFGDGTFLPHQVMRQLLDSGRLALPRGLTTGAQWVIGEAANDARSASGVASNDPAGPFDPALPEVA